MRKACDVASVEGVDVCALRVCIVFHNAVSTAKALFQNFKPHL